MINPPRKDPLLLLSRFFHLLQAGCSSVLAPHPQWPGPLPPPPLRGDPPSPIFSDPLFLELPELRWLRPPSPVSSLNGRTPRPPSPRQQGSFSSPQRFRPFPPPSNRRRGCRPLLSPADSIFFSFFVLCCKKDEADGAPPFRPNHPPLVKRGPVERHSFIRHSLRFRFIR